MPVKREDLRSGTVIQVEAFEATILEVDATASTVKVQDDAGNVSYVYLNRLTKIAPYKNGAVYLSNGRTFYRYVAGAKPGENGTWMKQQVVGSNFTDSAGFVREVYTYPGRPMREVTLSEPVAE
jgi:hypothetical protein